MFSPDEILLGRIAVRAGFITQAQLDEAVAVQERSTPAPTLGAILIEFGYITPKTLAEILELQRAALAQPHATSDESLIDSLFGKLAVKLGYTTPDQVNECIRLQAKQAAMGDPVKLGRLLMDKGYIKEDQVRFILRLQHIDLVGCPKCGKWYDSQGTPPSEWPPCKHCGGPMSRLSDLGTIDATEILAGAAETLADDVAPVRRPQVDVNQPPRRQERKAGRQENNIIEEAALQGRQQPSTTTRPNADALGQSAVQRGWITQAQLDESLTIQQMSAAPIPLGQVLVKQGFLKPAQLDALVAGQDQALAKKLKLPPLSAKESRLGNLAVRRGYLTQERLDAALRERARNAAVGYDQALGTVLVQKGYLSRAQLDDLLRKQSRVRRVIVGRHRQAAASQAGWVAAAAGLLAMMAWGVIGGGAGLPSRPDGSRATSPTTARRTAPPPKEKYGEDLLADGGATRSLSAEAAAEAGGRPDEGAGRSLPAAVSAKAGARPAGAWSPPEDSNPISSMSRVPDGTGWEGPPAPTPEGQSAAPIVAASAATAAVEETSSKTFEPPPELARYRIPWDRARWLTMARELDALLAAPPSKEKPVYYLGEDWRARGTWMGRYGLYHYSLCAMTGLGDVTASDIVCGKHHVPLDYYIGEGGRIEDGTKDEIRRWIHRLYWDDPRVLQNPLRPGTRRQSEVDNHQESYRYTNAGLDIYVDIPLTRHPGLYAISLYFFNKDGHNGDNRFRDYWIEVKDDVVRAKPGFDVRFSQMPLLAKARVRMFRGGVYHRFLFHGNRNYTLRLANNHSFNTILGGVFIDQLSDREPSAFRAKSLTAMLQESFDKEDRFLLRPANVKDCLAMYVSRTQMVLDRLKALRSSRPQFYFSRARTLYLAILPEIETLADTRSPYWLSWTGFGCLARLYPEVGDFDRCEGLLDTALASVKQHAAQARNPDDSHFIEAMIGLDDILDWPWVVGPEDVPVWRAYVEIVTRCGSEKERVEMLRRSMLPYRSLMGRVVLDDALRSLMPDLPRRATVYELHAMGNRLEAAQRLEDALGFYSAALEAHSDEYDSRQLIDQALRVAMSLDRPEEVERFRILDAEWQKRFPQGAAR